MPLPLILVGVGAGVSLLYSAYRDINKDELNERMATELSEWRKFCEQLVSSRSDKAASSASASTLRRHSVAQASSSSLEIQNEYGETALSISEIDDPRPRRWKNMHDSEKNSISRLNPLLSTVPLAAIAGNVATTRYMVVQCTGTLRKAADGEGFRAIVRDGKKIVEQARLFSPEQLTRIVTVGAVWQIASIAVAQKHLHDINEKLQVIGRKVEEIHTFQKNERTSKILACRKYFQQIYEDIRQDNLSINSQIGIESQCVKMQEIEEHLCLEVEGMAQEIVENQFGEDLDNVLQKWAENMRELMICIETRILGYQLMAIGSEDPNLVDNRLGRIRDDIERVKDNVRGLANYVVKILSEDASFWDNLGKVERSLEVLQELRIPEKIGSSLDRVGEEVAVARNIVEQRKAPQEVMLKINGGKIEGFAVAEG